jgi:ribonuclease HI
MVSATDSTLEGRYGPPMRYNRLLCEEDQAVARSSRDTGLHVVFEKVKGHSGDEYNEEADRLATLGKNGTTSVEVRAAP